MRTTPVSFIEKIKVWIFGQIVWRLIYRLPLTRRLFHRLLPALRMDRARIQTVLGQKLLINPNRSVWEMKLWLLGMYEPEVVDYFITDIQAGQVVVDIGANIGLFSLMAAEIVGPHGRVIAYEPHPDTFRELQDNLKRNGYTNVQTVSCAISDKPGFLRMNVFADCDLNSVALTADYDVIDVPARTLDDSLDELGIDQCHLIKMDIEGAEWFALRGIDRTLKRNPDLRMLIEMHNPQIRSLGGRPEELLQMLMDRGFTLYEINMWRGRTIIRSPAEIRIHGHLLCIRESKKTRRFSSSPILQ
jgi:FkbM family methyltransferase